VSVSSSQSKWHKVLGRMLDERAALLDLKETNLEVSEEILVEELERGPHPLDG
jgi:hypothetical protein